MSASAHALESGLGAQAHTGSSPWPEAPQPQFNRTPSFQSDKGDPQPPQPLQPRQLWPAWKQQFVDAIEYDSKAAEDGEEPGGMLGLVMHFVSIFWKLCCATIPPEWWMGGWPCFWGSLVWIIAMVSAEIYSIY